MNEGRASGLLTVISNRTAQLWSRFAWEFSGHPQQLGECFTISGEGDLDKQLLALYWLERAPELEGWMFYASRQPGPGKGLVEIANRSFDPKAFWIVPTVDTESEKIDIAVWHPHFGELEESERWTVLFLFLDDVLGEYGTQGSIGKITFDPNARLSEAVSSGEIGQVVAKARADNGWTEFLPGQSAVVYRSKNEPDERFLRGDIIIGRTTHLRLTREHAETKGDLPDPLAGSGADYVFVAFDSQRLPRGEQADRRGQLEDALDAALKTEKSGRLIGGAHGAVNAYIDLLLYDGAASIEIVKRILKAAEFAHDATINYFAREKRGWRVAV